MTLVWIEDYLLNVNMIAMAEPAGENACTVFFSSGLNETINVSLEQLYALANVEGIFIGSRNKEADRE